VPDDARRGSLVLPAWLVGALGKSITDAKNAQCARRGRRGRGWPLEDLELFAHTSILLTHARPHSSQPHLIIVPAPARPRRRPRRPPHARGRDGQVRDGHTTEVLLTSRTHGSCAWASLRGAGGTADEAREGQPARCRNREAAGLQVRSPRAATLDSRTSIFLFTLSPTPFFSYIHSHAQALQAL
jgi:hypothetical protein